MVEKRVSEWLQNSFDLTGKKIWVVGHNGMVGSAILRSLADEGGEVLTVGRDALDLRRQADVEAWMRVHRPEVVIIAAATVGGIHANATRPADFLYDNMMIEANIIHAAYECGVEKLLFLGSSCIYPKEAVQPITEDALLSGPLESTNEAYAIAKIAGVKLCEAYRKQHGCDFISAMPCNLYGQGDSFDLESSHVIPAVMMKAHAAKISVASEMVVWGSGTPLREFLYVDDLADGLVHLLKHYSGVNPVNIGSGQEISIYDLSKMIANVVGFEGEIVMDESKPDGVLRKVMDSSKIRDAGWRPKTSLRVGLEKTYAWYCAQNQDIKDEPVRKAS